jgi:dihydropteroate synthase
MKLKRTLQAKEKQLNIGDRTLIMGILNVTPDSFSDGGHFHMRDAAIRHALSIQQDGADLIDVGGESTRPGASFVSVEEELDRVIPIVEALKREVDLPISIDTYKSQVAEEALKAGAHIVNDVWGGQMDERIGLVVASYGVPYILMHNRTNREYNNFPSDVITDLHRQMDRMKQFGVKDEQIILDPGLGFAKSYSQNLQMMNHLDRIVEMGYPVLLGTSRKSMIGLALDLPVEERLEGTLATLCLGVVRGCHIVRVHDVKEAYRCCRMMDIMLRANGQK